MTGASSVGAVGEALAARRAMYELIDADAAAERWPGMRFGEAVLVQPDAGCCNADATVVALQRQAAVHGAGVHHSLGSS